MNSPAFRCVRCAGRVKPRQGFGRTYAYRVFPAMAVPATVEIPTCGRCSATYIDEATAVALSPVLEAEYKRELSRRAKQALADLSPFLSQRKLERILDISQGYLCRIACGHGMPSAQLVSVLALLAQDPTLLEWLARYWTAPRPLNLRPIRPKQKENR